MFTVGVSKNTQGNLAILGKQTWISPFYLAGGTSCSLYIGHRFSFDLDFFTTESFNPKFIASKLKGLGKLSIDQQNQGTFLGHLNDIKISFFLYPYKLIFPKNYFLGVAIADIRDIACMKIDAISTRGTKRDFIDLFFICKKYNLSNLFNLFAKKYSGVEYNVFHNIKSLAYFANADQEEIPKMVLKVEWKRIKEFFIEEQRRLTKKLLEI